MIRETRRQPNRKRQERQISGIHRQVSMRSPALEAAEQKRAEQGARMHPIERVRRGGRGVDRGGGLLGRPQSADSSIPAKNHRASNGRTVRYAFEESLSTPVKQRKRLPRRETPHLIPSRIAKFLLPSPGITKASNKKAARTGITIGWPLQATGKAESQDAALQVISEEEQKKLAELEMRLPRVAGKIDSWLLIIVLALLCIGIVMVYSASAFVAARDQGDASYYFQRELIWVVLGIIAMLVTIRVDYRQWRRFSLIGMAIILPLLVIVLKFGVSVYGASRWLAFGSFFSFQPSELTKLVLALYIADWLSRKGKQVGTLLYGLLPFVLLVGLVLGLVLLENDMGTAIIIAAFATAMFFTAGANIAQFLLALACGGLIFLKEALKGYRYYRITGFLDPFKDITSINLQLYQALLALGSGGWFGLGLGASRQKTGYLPLPFTDSIFAIIGEELGFIGCSIIILLFLFLAFRGFRLARRTQDLYGALLATGITSWLVVQAMVNIGANTGSIPYTGVPLPFISFGGSSLVVSLAAVGVLLNISRYIQEPEAPALSRKTIEIRKRKGAITKSSAQA